jgi:hypothetical protein
VKTRWKNFQRDWDFSTAVLSKSTTNQWPDLCAREKQIPRSRYDPEFSHALLELCAPLYSRWTAERKFRLCHINVSPHEPATAAAQNPVAAMYSRPLRNNTSLGAGPNHDKTANVLKLHLCTITRDRAREVLK